MKKYLQQIVTTLGIVLGIGIFLAPVPAVGAVNVDPLAGVCSGSGGSGSQVCASKDDNIGTTIATVIRVLLFVVGIISVIMIIIGGIMYAVSAGDAGAITKAKNTILYAIVGLAVSFFAYAIVTWVVDRFK